jgi:hypothetical protein
LRGELEEAVRKSSHKRVEESSQKSSQESRRESRSSLDVKETRILIKRPLKDPEGVSWSDKSPA